MAGSLRDQLVKAGLATSAQAKKAERQANRDKNQQHKKPAAEKKPNVKQRAQQLKKEKVEKDRALAQTRNEKYAARAMRAEIKQMIMQNDQRVKTSNDTDVPYNFVHGKKIKRIYLPESQRTQLVNGSLVIVNNDGLYHFLSKEVADKIAQRDPKRIIVANADKTQEQSEDDEYYAKFAIPDDLDW